jgi:hypothetical protein
MGTHFRGTEIQRFSALAGFLLKKRERSLRGPIEIGLSVLSVHISNNGMQVA